MSTDYKVTMHDERIFALLDKTRPEAMEPALKWLLAKSKPLTPIDMRTDRDNIVLRATGRVLFDPDNGVGAVVYGDDDTAPYAVRQHEDLTLHHPVPGTRAKFLEEPYEQGKDTMLLMIATAYRRMLLGR